VILIFLFTIFSIRDVGTTAFPLLKVGIGPKPSALGEAYVGLPTGVSAIFWNPAGLIGRELQFEVSHQEWFGGIRDEVLGIKLPNGLGVGFLHSSSGEIEVWDATNYPGTEPTITVATEYLQLGYGGRIAKEWHYGLGTKMLMESGYREYTFAFGADLGIIHYQKKRFGFGLVVNHLTPKFYYGKAKVTLPITISIGGIYERVRPFRFLTALSLPIDNRPILKLGAEYEIKRIVALRLGYRTGPQDLKNLGFLSGLTAGLGVKIDRYEINYCFVPYGELGLTHRIGITALLPYGGYRLKVKVYDQDDQAPLPAHLQLTGIITDDRSADRLGRYEARIKKKGWVYFTVSHDGYFTKIDSTYLFGDRDQEYRIGLKKIGEGMIYGHLYDAFTKEPLEGRITYDGPIRGEAMTTTHGTFKIKELPEGSYLLIGHDRYGAYYPDSVPIQVEPGVMKSCEIYLIKKKEPIVLKAIHFETAKAELTEEAKAILDEIGRVIKENPEIGIEISGHTDAREIRTAEFKDNWELSLARANAVKDYLVKKCRIDHRRLITKGYADTRPIAPNTTEEGMAKNRRVEFKIIR